jgi:outer membrane protein insertion porin family
MGGENDLRGYDIRSISPVTFIPVATSAAVAFIDPTNLSGNGTPLLRSFTVPVLTYTATLPGGDIQSSGNVEYRIPIVGPVTASVFLDGGTDGIVRQSALQLNPSGLTSLQQQFPQANVQSQLSIASGTNFRLRGSTGIEFGVQLPIVQAPFRIYYAYNLNRLHSEIVSPPDYINPTEIKLLQDTLCGGVPINSCNTYKYEILPTLQQFTLNPGRLNYFEPKTTFRFTVGKTF